MFAARCALVLTLAGTAVPAAAISPNQWDDIGTVVDVGLVASAVGITAYRSDWTGLKQYALTGGVSGGTALILKNVINEERPNGSGNDSFPSGHTTIAFASAGYIQQRYGWTLGAPALVAATFVGFTRVQAKQHYWYDVVAGAVMGEVSALVFTSAWNEKVQVTPWADSKGGGVAIRAQF